jgi:hypothetical protein
VVRVAQPSRTWLTRANLPMVKALVGGVSPTP